MKIVVAVYDSKAESYGEMPSALACVLSKGDAIRGFEAECRNEKSKLHAFPTDFSLWQLGEFDERAGQIKVLPQKINLSNAWEVPQDSRNITEDTCNNQEEVTASKTRPASQSTGQHLRPSTPTKQHSQPRI